MSSGEDVWHLPRTLGAPDAHGNQTATWPAGPNAPGAVRISGAKVAPRTDLTGEAALADREAVVTNKRVLLPAGARVAPVDRMWVRGETYDVIGEAGIWVNPWRQQETGVEIALKRTEG